MFLKGKAIIGILVLLVLGYTALWYTSGFKAQKNLQQTLSSWRDQGFEVEFSNLSLSGFPYRIVLDVKDFSFKTRKGGLSLQSKKMALVSHLWTPQHWVVQAQQNRISVADQLVAWQEGFIEASYRVHTGDKLVIKIDSAGTDDMQWRSPEGAPTLKAWTLLLGRDGDDPARRSGLYEKRTLEFKLFAETSTGSLDVGGGVSGPAIQDWSRHELENWRDAGGLLEIDQASIVTPDGTLTLKGDVSLDENLRLLGAANITAETAEPVRFILNSMGWQTPNITSTQDMALMLQNGYMLLDSFEVTELKALKP